MLRNDERAYGAVSMAFHWIVALLFLCQIPLGYLTQAAASRPALQFELYQWHKSIGMFVLLVAVPRLLWALTSTGPGLPEGLTVSEQRASRWAHLVLYALTVFVPLAGWAIASTSPLRIPTYAFNLVLVPDLPLAVSERGERIWSTIHAVLAYAAGALAVLHMLAAFWHHFHRKDDVLRRMLPVRPSTAHRRYRLR